MFYGMPIRAVQTRIIPTGNANSRVYLRASDPDRILIDILNGSSQSSGTCSVELPTDAPIGKQFTIQVICSNNSISNGFPTTAITVSCGQFSTTLGYGNKADVYMTRNGWDTTYNNGLAIGPGATTARGSTSSGAIAIGVNAVTSYNASVGIGNNAVCGTESVAIGGGTATALSHAVAVGYTTTAGEDGTALGMGSGCNNLAGIALGMWSKATRRGELFVSTDHLQTNKQGFSILSWIGDTTNATPTEIYGLAGAAATSRMTLANSSAFSFNIQAIARNNVDDVTSGWTLVGVIKRGANAAATALVGTVTKTVIGADAGAATWDIAATADTTNGALIVTVTGETGKTIRWSVRGDISELRF